MPSGILQVGPLRGGKTSLAYAQQDAEALEQFRRSVPQLVASSREEDTEDVATSSLQQRRLHLVLETYITLLQRAGGDADVRDALRLADVIRNRAVQGALQNAAARIALQTPALADLARSEQDLHQQILVQASTMSKLLQASSAPAVQAKVSEMQRTLQRLRSQRAEARSRIARQFPKYSELTSPQPASAEDIQKSLRSDEALVSFYFGYKHSFVWVLRGDGRVAMAPVDLTATMLSERIARLRKALDFDAVAVDKVPEFDVDAAHELYTKLLKPVESVWRDAKSLVVVTNGALGQFPLTLLPLESPAGINRHVGQPFAWYRQVRWLARTHSISYVPTASALAKLRALPAPSAKREAFIGFGDPIFNDRQAAAAAGPARPQQPSFRSSAKVIRPVFSDLPRLPDTAEELLAIADALGVDPKTHVFLGKAANEKAVTGTDLRPYRIVAFATHGLSSGEIDGLTQPALALTAPRVAGVPGDGLLTFEEILQLRLEADWVLLSACNTAAGATESADAVSGLGRAFLYAGTRSLLVTSWGVESASARQIVTELFRRQAQDPNLTRAEALQTSVLSLIDHGEAKDARGNTTYLYAHPSFWAPFSIVGDGGAR